MNDNKDYETEQLNRVPPQNIDAERMILGAMMIADSSKFTVPIGLEKIKDDAFYKEAHCMIYLAIAKLFDNASSIDLATVTVQLEKHGNLEKVGGVPYLNEMIESVPTVDNLEHYIKIVRDDALKRRVLHISAKIYNDSFNDAIEAQDLTTKAQQLMMEVSDEVKSDLHPIKSIIKDTFKYIQSASENPDSLTGISTGFADLDAMIAGLQNGELSIIGARPSMGKSTFLQNIITHVAIDLKKPVLLFSPEMSERQILIRMLGASAKIPTHALRMGALRDSDWPRLTIAAGVLSEAPIIIDDTASPSIGDLRKKAYQAKEIYGIELIMVDYIQKLIDSSRRYGTREQEMTAISNGLQALARELDVPVVVTSQLNRSVEGRPDKRPQLSDLRDSGAIEQDADMVAFLYREKYYEKDCKDDVTEVIVSKQRNGPIGTIKLYFNLQQLRFENLARGYKDDDPY